ncbi:MAG TPA: hypothetical protein VMT99_02750 [Candidatus Paceibacterota bacterium]|nr:hypothetical protein [Candidatus Paceibacterota bacterium]
MEEKPFDTLWIVALILLAVANDALEVVFDLFAASVVGLPGEAIMEPINLLFDGFFTSVFVIKVGFGWPAILQFIDDVLQLFFIPGRTAAVLIGIRAANNPKSLASKIIRKGAALEGGGELAAAEGAAENAATEKLAETAEQQTVQAAEGARPAGARRGQRGVAQQDEQGDDQENESDERERAAEEALTPPEERNPVEVAQEEEFEQMPEPEKPGNENRPAP